MSEFKSHKVVPDVISTWPDKVCDLHFHSGIHSTLGEEISTKMASGQPKIKLSTTDGKYYCVLMVDPDAPNRKDHTYRNWLHFLVVNIPGGKNDHLSLSSNHAHRIAEYQGPAPPKDSGLHRYVVLVYEQPKGILELTNIDDIKDDNRKNFDIDTWMVSTFGKDSLPKLYAGNFFQAQYAEK